MRSKMSGELARDADIENAKRKHKDWQKHFREVAYSFIKSGKYFTAEDIVEVTGLPSGDVGMNKNNVVGAMMNSIVREGNITRVGYTKSRRRTSHAKQASVWSRKTERTAKKCPTCGR